MLFCNTIAGVWLLDSEVVLAKTQPETLVKKPEDLVDLGESFG